LAVTKSAACSASITESAFSIARWSASILWWSAIS
jgi:hypothetical protein